jgi:hypothetical protein
MVLMTRNLLFIALFSILGCSLESEHNLGSDFYLLGDQENTVVSKKVPNKRGVYDDVILGKIEDYEFDKKFILIYRNASESSRIYFENHPLWEAQKGKDTLQYWIIDKERNSIIGPLRKSEYLVNRKEMKIPSDLKLQSE